MPPIVVTCNPILLQELLLVQTTPSSLFVFILTFVLFCFFTFFVLSVFGGPPVGNGANIGVFTNLATNYTSIIISGTSNTFAISLTAQNRSYGGVTGN
jgi:hypothetical protein